MRLIQLWWIKAALALARWHINCHAHLVAYCHRALRRLEVRFDD